jgi:translation initiation factor IF-3
LLLGHPWVAAARLALLFVTPVLPMYAAAGVDLVEVNPKADPPICRLRDTEAMQKKEDERKSKAEKQARAEKGKMKKIRMSPRTDDGGILVKSGQIAKMLRKGQTIQVFIFANSHKDKLIVHDNAMPLLEQLYQQVFADCEEDGCCWYAVGSTLLLSQPSCRALFTPSSSLTQTYPSSCQVPRRARISWQPVQYDFGATETKGGRQQRHCSEETSCSTARPNTNRRRDTAGLAS